VNRQDRHDELPDRSHGRQRQNSPLSDAGGQLCGLSRRAGLIASCDSPANAISQVGFRANDDQLQELPQYAGYCSLGVSASMNQYQPSRLLSKRFAEGWRAQHKEIAPVRSNATHPAVNHLCHHFFTSRQLRRPRFASGRIPASHARSQVSENRSAFRTLTRMHFKSFDLGHVNNGKNRLKLVALTGIEPLFAAFFSFLQVTETANAGLDIFAAILGRLYKTCTRADLPN
jgi:hypothetical protein